MLAPEIADTVVTFLTQRKQPAMWLNTEFASSFECCSPYSTTLTYQSSQSGCLDAGMWTASQGLSLFRQLAMFCSK